MSDFSEVDALETWLAYKNSRLASAKIISIFIFSTVVLRIVVRPIAQFNAWHELATLIVAICYTFSNRLRNSRVFTRCWVWVWVWVYVFNCVLMIVHIRTDRRDFYVFQFPEVSRSELFFSAAIRFLIAPLLAMVVLVAIGCSLMDTIVLSGILCTSCAATLAFIANEMVSHISDVLDVVLYAAFTLAVIVQLLLTNKNIYFAVWTRAKDLVDNERVQQQQRQQIISYIFHEVRNPINTISLAADLAVHQLNTRSHILSDNCKHNEILQREMKELSVILNSIVHATEAAAHVLNDALSLQRLQAGAFTFAFEPFDLLQLHLEAMEMVRPSLNQKSIQFTIETDTRLNGIFVIGDWRRIQQVLLNFLSNAAKFTPVNGCVTIRLDQLHIHEERGKEYVKIRSSVTNTGERIKKDDWPKIFQPWSQIRPMDQQQGRGSGLGLAICKDFIECGHNGKIGFDSSEETSFWFEIDFAVASPPSGDSGVCATATDVELGDNSPVTVTRQPTKRLVNRNPLIEDIEETEEIQDDDEEPVVQEHSIRFALTKEVEEIDLEMGVIRERAEKNSPSNDCDPIDCNTSGGGNNVVADYDAVDVDVVVVEDSEMTRMLMSRTLDTLNITYALCIHGKEAVDLLTGSNPVKCRIILMDKEMPVMDGYVATKLLRAAHVSAKIVGVTGNVMDEQVSEFMRYGANEVVSKPITRKVLEQILQRYGCQIKPKKILETLD